VTILGILMIFCSDLIDASVCRQYSYCVSIQCIISKCCVYIDTMTIIVCLCGIIIQLLFKFCYLSIIVIRYIQWPLFLMSDYSIILMVVFSMLMLMLLCVPDVIYCVILSVHSFFTMFIDDPIPFLIVLLFFLHSIRWFVMWASCVFVHWFRFGESGDHLCCIVVMCPCVKLIIIVCNLCILLFNCSDYIFTIFSDDTLCYWGDCCCIDCILLFSIFSVVFVDIDDLYH